MTETEEKILQTFRPTWASFFVYFFGILVCLIGPWMNTDSPLSPAMGIFIALIFVVVIIYRRFNHYTLTNKNLIHRGIPGIQDITTIALTDIDDIQINQGIALRAINHGHIFVHSKKRDDNSIVIYGQPEPVTFKFMVEELAKAIPSDGDNEEGK